MQLPTPLIVTTTPSQTAWSYAQHWRAGQREYLLVLSLELSTANEMLDLSSLGQAIVSHVGDVAAADMNLGQLMTLSQEARAGLAEDVRCTMALLARDSAGLLAVGTEGIVVWIVRQGDIVDLSTHLSVGIHGPLLANDRICVATQALVELVGAPVLSTWLRDEQSALEQLPTAVRRSEQAAAAAGIVWDTPPITPTESAPVVMQESWWERFGKIPLKVVSPLESIAPRVPTWVAALVLGLLVIAIGVGLVQRARVARERAYTNTADQVTADLQEARSIVDLNPGRARALITEAKDAVSGYQKRDLNERERARAGELAQQITQAEGEIFKIEEKRLDTFVTLDLLASKLTATRMTLYDEDTLVFPDLQAPRLVGMNVRDKSALVWTITNASKIRAATHFDTTLYTLGEQGIVAYLTKKKTDSVVIPPDEMWSQIQDVASFAGNLYLLDTGASEVWKYPVITDGFGDRRRWLAAGITPDLSGVIQFRVVGDIWFLTQSGKVERYSRGAPVKLSLQGFPASTDSGLLNDPQTFFVSDDALYVVEGGAKRLVVFGLDGVYKRQYVSDDFAHVDDMVVVGETAYFLSENTVKTLRL